MEGEEVIRIAGRFKEQDLKEMTAGLMGFSAGRDMQDQGVLQAVSRRGHPLFAGFRNNQESIEISGFDCRWE